MGPLLTPVHPKNHLGHRRARAPGACRRPYTYDALGELVHAWTSNITPGGSGTGCRSSGGTNWGYQEDGTASSGPVTDAPDTAADTTSPDAGLTASLAAAAPATGTVSTGATAYRQSFTFDWLGNRATLTEHDTADATKNVTYRYGYGLTGPPAGQPHTLAWISSTPSGRGSSYTNDAVGNTKVRDLAATTQQLEWTAENKLSTITDDGVKTTYVYDADGNRVLENSPAGSTLYLGETELTTDSTGKIIRSSRAYAHPDAPTVVRTTVNGATTGHKLNVLIADHLGTANTTVELGGTQTVTRRAFKPYGEARGPKPSTWPNKRSYLGVGIDDAATGLTHIGAREYDQAAGRFLSADPVIDIADPLQMNGYAYANNSPVSSSDPTGLMAMANRSGGNSPPPPASSGSSTTVTYTTTKTVTVTKPAPCDWLCRVKGFAREHITVITVVTEVVVGVGCGIGAAAAGAATAGVGAVVVGTACGAAAGAVAGVVGNAIDPKADHSLGGYVSAAGKGAAVGAVSGVVGAGVGKLAGMAVAKIAQTAVGQAIGTGLKAAGSKLMGKGGASARAGAGTAQCFLAGTPVLLADGTSKNIEDIEVGDEVLATNPATGETSAQPVTELLPSEGEKELNELTITTAKGNKKITATAEHPFWVPRENAWINAADLKPGTTLSTPDGTTARIVGNRPYTDHVRTYNFSVAKLHTYYVLAGTTPVLVHNSCGPDGDDLVHVYRAAQRGNGEDELANGLNPSRHAGGNGLAYVGSEDVVSKGYADYSVGTHEDFYTKFTFDRSDFEKHFGTGLDYEGGPGKEWEIPHAKIDLFNQLTIGREKLWAPW